MSLPNITKLSQIVWKLWLARDFGFRVDKYIIKKMIVLLHATRLLVLIYASIKFYQNISKYSEVIYAQEIDPVLVCTICNIYGNYRSLVI